jgi:uncharacterized RDD family membrane protein YckC
LEPSSEEKLRMSKPPPTPAAGIVSRGAALLLDIALLIFVAAVAPDALHQLGPAAMLLAVFLYFAGMPLTPLQGTLGKWICRIKICDRAGMPLTWRSSAVRAAAAMCWLWLPLALAKVPFLEGLKGDTLSLIWGMLLPLPWAAAGFLPRRETLFDLLADSLVVRYRADTESIARAEPAQTTGIVNTAGVAVLAMAIGAGFTTMTDAGHERNRRSRVGYAIEQTMPLREKIEAFHEREKRWPTPAELSVPEWTPYRDGGGYRLRTDGSILITFSVLPDLKGRNIIFRPMQAAGSDQIKWQCSIDPALKPGYVPASCR